MDKELQMILDFFKAPSVNYNRVDSSYWGVVVGDDAVMVASGFFMAEIRNIKFKEKPEGKFFSYLEDKFTDYKYPLDPGRILESVESQLELTNSVVFPVKNILNRLIDIDENANIDKSRVIISPGTLDEGDLTIKFTHNGREWEFKHSALPAPIKIHENSVIGSDGIRNGVVYRCKVVESHGSDGIYVSVLEPFGKSRLGVLYSPNGFIPENMDKINSMSGIIPPDMIIGTNDVDHVCGEVVPIHLRSSLLLDLLKIFLNYTESIRFHLPGDFNKPVMITNERKNEDDVDIRIILATLNTSYGAQRG